ncbi:hypothetical protein C8Q70DRAFT_1120410 [Cubamyces menziesii]|nr:hypothetical protein C8Q70DRAFT_1120410 [Cubamyces menziesii]
MTGIRFSLTLSLATTLSFPSLLGPCQASSSYAPPLLRRPMRCNQHIAAICDNNFLYTILHGLLDRYSLTGTSTTTTRRQCHRRQHHTIPRAPKPASRHPRRASAATQPTSSTPSRHPSCQASPRGIAAVYQRRPHSGTPTAAEFPTQVFEPSSTGRARDSTLGAGPLWLSEGSSPSTRGSGG